MLWRIASLIAVCALVASAAAQDNKVLRAGFAAVDITPDVEGEKRVFLAGYRMNRKATGVHDKLFARTVVLACGDERIAVACVDLIGLQYPQVKAIRAKLSVYRNVLVSSTHNHEGPDVIGIWGRGPFHRGVDDAYLDRVVDCVARSVN